MATPVRHETRALLRAHLSAASSYRHLTRHCPICHRLLKLAMDGAPRGSQGPQGPERAAEGERPTPRDTDTATDTTGAADSRPA